MHLACSHEPAGCPSEKRLSSFAFSPGYFRSRYASPQFRQQVSATVTKYANGHDIYNRARKLVGPVIGPNVEKVQRYVVQAKTGG
jgi:hypothetical protein